ncbi:MAG TPA: acetate--CoA ligase family protein, partial [Streptosporangiaceae bacterium]|nr:acetate--CoA ligase family protein [Streptosporangiaceae bacterium]
HCYGIRLTDAEPVQSDGTAVKIGVTHDRVFGPLVVFGPGDHAARLTPLTDIDADTLIRGVPGADLDTLRELLLRVSRLADDLPEVTELELNPVIAKPHGVFAVDARIKLMPCLPQDPFLRRLR